MSNVSIIWSTSNGGDAIAAIVDHGNSSNGDTTSAQELFIRHDGDNSITNTKLYIRAVSGTYSGTLTAVADLAEILSWGDQSTEAAFGGLQCNFLATSSYATSGWPTYSSKDQTDEEGDDIIYRGFVHRTGVGDNETNAVDIPTTAGATAAGEIQAGSTPNVRFQMRMQIPAAEGTVGIRQWDSVLTYSYTS